MQELLHLPEHVALWVPAGPSGSVLHEDPCLNVEPLDRLLDCLLVDLLLDVLVQNVCGPVHKTFNCDVKLLQDPTLIS